MIKFKYTFKEDLLKLVRETIVNYTSDFVVGYMQEGDVGNLAHSSLYLMCECVQPTPNMRVYQNPIAIIARNQYTATTLFREITGSESGTVLCELENKCNDINVEPIE